MKCHAVLHVTEVTSLRHVSAIIFNTHVCETILYKLVELSKSIDDLNTDLAVDIIFALI